MTWRILELFSGVGAWRWAAGGRGTVAAAYDISTEANRTYALTHSDPPIVRELATVRAEELASHGADTWLLSPPCQPYCRMGRRLDLADRRAAAFVHLVAMVGSGTMQRLALENVEGFLGSEAHALLIDRLHREGFDHREFQLCPTRFGIPNRRPRLFLVASWRPLVDLQPPDLPAGPVSAFLDSEENSALYLDERALARHGPGLDIVTGDSRRTACFIGGYGRRYVGSGSFLRTERGIRRFSPAEIARLLSFPEVPAFPEDLPLAVRYKLLGNALNVAVARWVLGAFGAG